MGEKERAKKLHLEKEKNVVKKLRKIYKEYVYIFQKEKGKMRKGRPEGSYAPSVLFSQRNNSFKRVKNDLRKRKQEYI